MERKRTRTVLSKEAYEAIGKTASESRSKLSAPQSVQFLHQGALRMLLFFFPTQEGEPAPLVLLVDRIEELKGARLADLKTARLSPSRAAVIVDGVDAFISVEGLFRDLSASSPAIKALVAHTFAAKGGKTTSEAKKRSSSENGKKGGRPTKKQREHALAVGKAKH